MVLKSCGIEDSILRPAAKIAGSNLPNQVAARLQVIRTDASFTGVLSKFTQFGAAVQGQDGILTEGAEAHGGDVQ